jgi:septal ring factor EnvC (AmiA/AmiB activator)
MNTNPETLPARLREIADAILFGRPSLVARQSADRLEELERELAAVTAAIHKIHPTRRGSLVDMAEDLESHRETAMNAFRLSEKELAAERALADRLAHWLAALDGEGIVPPAWDASVANALAAWKEARNPPSGYNP